MTAVKLFKIRRGERTFRRLEEGNAIRLTETLDDLIIIGFSGVFDGDVVINGDLTVNGTTTTINSTNHVIADNKIVINDGEIGAGVVTLGTKAGLTVDRGSETDVEWCWDETRDIWTTFGELLGDVADPTQGIHVGDRDFNDARYLQNVVEDGTPQLGGDLNVSTFGISFGGPLVLAFASGGEAAVNNIELVHAITGSGPIIRSVGADTNVDLELSSKGTGVVNITGAVTVSSTVDGRDLAVDGTKLDTIETNAKDDQDLWETVSGDSGSTAANNSTDTLTIAGGTSITTAMSGDTLTITNDDPNVDQNLWETVAGDSGSTAANITTDTLTIAGAGLISTAMSGDTLTISTTATAGGLNNVVEDLTPALGGDLSVDAFNLIEDGNVILSFESAGELAVNWVDIENALTGAGPTIRSVGTDTNVDLNFTSKGTGVVNITGAVTVSSTVDGRDLATDGTKLDLIEANAKDDQTAADIRGLGFFDTTNDGTGSGLDADLLDGNEATAFATAAQGTTADSALQNVVEDTTPQLGGQLDVDGKGLGDGINLLLDFVEDESAVNYIEIENEATGSGPIIRSVGADTNVDLNISAKGLGRVNITNDSAVAGAFVNDALDTLDVAVTTIQGLHYLGAFTVAGLPSAAANTNRLALATNATVARTLVISDGTDWKVFAVEGAIVTSA